MIIGQSPALNEAEISNLTAFYEWALEAEMTPEQRVQFRAYLEDDLKRRPESARASYDSLLGSWAKIKQASEEARQKTRIAFLTDFLPELKRSTDDDDRFLLEIYRAAHGGRDTLTSDNEEQPAVAVQSRPNNVPGGSSALIGKWERYTGSGSITDGTGKTKYGNGTTYSFEFGPGGTVIYKVVEKTLSIMGCNIETTDRATGRFTISGDTMNISLGAGTSVGTDSCSKAGNYNKPLPPASLTVKFAVKRSDSILRPDHPTLLCFEGGDGEACYEKLPAPRPE